MDKDYDYPLIKALVTNSKSETFDSNSVYLLACQHILEPQAFMFRQFVQSGFLKNNIRIFGKVYSTSEAVRKDLVTEGFSVAETRFDSTISFDELHKKICEEEFDTFIRKVPPHARVVILDDGGELIRYANDRTGDFPDRSFFCVEQTSSGFRKLEKVQLKFPVYNVARSATKLIKESPIIADIGVRRIEEVIKKYSIDNPKILIAGLGPLGECVKTLLNEKHLEVWGYDIKNGEQQVMSLVKMHGINIIIGVTGSMLLSAEHLADVEHSVHDQLFLISMSSSDREFPAVAIRKGGDIPATIHQDVTMGKLVLVNNGFPITFKGNRFESTAQEIEKTITLLFGSTVAAATSGSVTPGFLPVSEEVENIANS